MISYSGVQSVFYIFLLLNISSVYSGIFFPFNIYIQTKPSASGEQPDRQQFHFYEQEGNQTVYYDTDFITTCEGYAARIACNETQKIKVYHAIYGRQHLGICIPTLFPNLTCHGYGVLEKVKNICEKSSTCIIPATNDFFGGNPCLGTRKYLQVAYRCVKDDSV